MSPFVKRKGPLGVTANEFNKLSCDVNVGNRIILSDGVANIIAFVKSNNNQKLQLTVFNNGGSSLVEDEETYEAELDEVIYILKA